MSGLSPTVTENYPTDTFVLFFGAAATVLCRDWAVRGAICTERMHSPRLMRNSRPQGVRDRK